MFVPDAAYITQFLMDAQRSHEGFHRKVAEIEALRYGEHKLDLPARDRPTGLHVRTMLMADLIESVKAAMLANTPRVSIKPIRQGKGAEANASRRENFWNAWLTHIMPALYEWVDAQVAVGLGVLKGAYAPWPVEPRQKRKGEKDREFNARVRALKQKLGPPFVALAPHLMTFYGRLGVGDRFVETLEHSYRPKAEVYAVYGLDKDSDLRKRGRGRMLDEDVERYGDRLGQLYGTMSGQPDERIRPLPYGTDTTTMCLVTEYCSEYVYQVWIGRRLIYEEAPPRVAYFPAIGRSTSSKDPDKLGLSVAEPFRFNEPIIDRSLTRIAEAIELNVNQRKTVELPEGSVDGIVLGADNRREPRTFEFSADKTQALPPGAKIVNVFEGAEKAYQAIPALQLLLEIMSTHGVAPIFKGQPPGASGSGYRDNSLYLMARSQFAYLVKATERAAAQYIDWMEDQIGKMQESVYMGELELRPSDITDWPATTEVKFDPQLPQNRIAEGTFYADMHDRGYGDRAWVYENGFGEEQPDELERRRLLEKVQDALDDLMIQDAISSVGIGSGPRPTDAGPLLFGPDGNPLAPRGGGPDGTQQLLGPGGGAGGSMSRGRPNGPRPGASRQPPFNPASFPPQ